MLPQSPSSSLLPCASPRDSPTVGFVQHGRRSPPHDVVSSPRRASSAQISSASVDVNSLASSVAQAVAARLMPQLNRMENRLNSLDVGSETGSVLQDKWHDGAMSRHIGGHRSRAFTGNRSRSFDYSLLEGQENKGPGSMFESGASDEDLSPQSQRSNTLFERSFAKIKQYWRLKEPARNGSLADLVHHGIFHKTSFVVIMLNTAYIWYLTDYSAAHRGSSLPEIVHTIELLFLLYYSLEIGLKLWVHSWWFFWNEDCGWNYFDTALVCFGIWEYVLFIRHQAMKINLTFLRVSRILRVTKVLRIFRTFEFMTELKVMLSCVMGSIIPLLWACIFLTVLLMISALIAVQSVTNYRVDNPECEDADVCRNLHNWFGTVASAMLSLFMSTTGGMDWGDIFFVLHLCGPAITVFFISYIVFFNFAFFNIVTSMFVDKAMKIAKPDEQALIKERKQDDKETAKMLRELFQKLDDDESGEIDVDELKRHSDDREMLHRFEMLGISVRDIEDFFTTLSAMTGGEKLDQDKFVDSCLKIKGPASSLEVQNIRFKVQELSKSMQKRSEEPPNPRRKTIVQRSDRRSMLQVTT